MTKRKVTFYSFDNPSQKEIIKALWAKYEPVLPPWILRVSFRLSTNEAEEVANIGMDLEYLNIKITIFPRFFSMEEHDMEHAFLHELSHTYIGDLTNWFTSVIEVFKVEETKAILSEELRVKMERTTEWLAYALKR
jgi:hypothetical protein